MSLAAQLSDHFDRAIRNRGHLYFVGGAVRLTESADRVVRATVRGSSPYRIELSLRGNDLHVSCTCPYYETEDLCKHLWATILTIDAKNLLRDAANNRALQLVLADEDFPAQENDEDDFDDESDELIAPRFTRKAIGAARKSPSSVKSQPQWKRQIDELSQSIKSDATQQQQRAGAQWPAHGREIFYIIDVAASLANDALILEVGYRERKAGGDWSKLKSQRLSHAQISHLPDPNDRQIMSLLAGAKEMFQWSGGYDAYEGVPPRSKLTAQLQQTLLPLICATDRCRLRRSAQDEELPALRWDDAPWEFQLEVQRDSSNLNYVFAGVLRRLDERMPLTSPLMVVAGGPIFHHDFTIAPLDDAGAPLWLKLLRERGEFVVPAAQAHAALTEILHLPQVPRMVLPAELRYEERSETAQPRVRLRPPSQQGWNNRHLRAELSFSYANTVIEKNDLRAGIYQPENKRLLLRDRTAEEEAAARLKQLGFRLSNSYASASSELELHPNNLPRVVRTLVAEGWHVEADGKLYKQPGAFSVAVKSGIDWFELHGAVEYDGGAIATLPALLAALKRGDNAVRLGDGTFGLLPEEWLKKYGALAGMGTADGDHLRFRPSQTGLLDALLAALPAPDCDETFARARERWRNFTGVEPHDPPASFRGQLRPYQREGLGWFHFLREFHFGGCLADDMGLGKTVQVLALLEERRAQKPPSVDAPRKAKKAPAKKTQKKGEQPQPSFRPSLIVVPKSLIFNWQQEAARFAPELRVLNYTGAERVKERSNFNDYDFALTTYGTLRRDAVYLKDIQFDYIVLDEAQAIKSAQTESAKASRLLRGAHKLALSGTPVENHMGELWSLFEFLNPGMLGTSSVFQQTANMNGNQNKTDEDSRRVLAHALRPFILRRTKEQVARELPPKLEQTLFCEMESAQRKFYDELRDYYRGTLLERVAREGLGKAKIHVLEALLRLRQAACHPGLVSREHMDQPSAKLDLLLPQLGEVIAEGHKVLVFSQFTSLLQIVRGRLDKEGITYEYLDGRTRDRAAKVTRFQNDSHCQLFLISLKAGGLGLNLTAAEYIFLLDPWWNPAVEAQAIDRAHRIGQTRRVFAYRLIARDTVEEKVVALQQTKRGLADAIINADNSLIRQLNREDLELLLS